MTVHHCLQVFKYAPRIARQTAAINSSATVWPETLLSDWRRWYMLLKLNAGLGPLAVLLGLALSGPKCRRKRPVRVAEIVPSRMASASQINRIKASLVGVGLGLAFLMSIDWWNIYATMFPNVSTDKLRCRLRHLLRGGAIVLGRSAIALRFGSSASSTKIASHR